MLSQLSTVLRLPKNKPHQVLSIGSSSNSLQHISDSQYILSGSPCRWVCAPRSETFSRANIRHIRHNHVRILCPSNIRHGRRLCTHLSFHFLGVLRRSIIANAFKRHSTVRNVAPPRQPSQPTWLTSRLCAAQRKRKAQREIPHAIRFRKRFRRAFVVVSLRSVVFLLLFLHSHWHRQWHLIVRRSAADRRRRRYPRADVALALQQESLYLQMQHSHAADRRRTSTGFSLPTTLAKFSFCRRWPHVNVRTCSPHARTRARTPPTSAITRLNVGGSAICVSPIHTANCECARTRLCDYVNDQAHSPGDSTISSRSLFRLAKAFGSIFSLVSLVILFHLLCAVAATSCVGSRARG